LVQGTTTGATPTTGISYGSVAGAYTADKNDVFYKFTATAEGIYTVTLNNPNPKDAPSGNDINLALYSDCGATGGLAELIGDGTVETMQYIHTGGTATYIIRAFSYNNRSGNFSIKVNCPAGPAWQIGDPNPGGDITAIFDNGTLTVSGTGMMLNFGSRPWDSIKDDITSVVINNGVTRIGNGAFQDCSNLVSASISNSVEIIGEHAFIACRNLTSLTMGNSVRDIQYGAFDKCSSLTSITIPSSVETIASLHLPIWTL
jgi:hypothetical protein